VRWICGFQRRVRARRRVRAGVGGAVQCLMRVSVLVLAIIVVAFIAHRAHMEARLLRADPNILPTDTVLLKFAHPKGKSLFESHCASCHGLKGQGDSARGVPNLSDEDWIYGSGLIADIERIISYGIRSHHPKAWNLATMPAYAKEFPSAGDHRIPPLAPGEIRDVVEFLWHEQGRDADAAAALRGARIFSDRGACYDCHSPDAKGDTAIGAPNLTDRITLYGDGSRQALFMSIAYGRQGMCPGWIKRLPPAAIREIAIYVYSLSHPPGGNRVFTHDK
jgi:cytochrome c oxidase cbb3-type subunit 3